MDEARERALDRARGLPATASNIEALSKQLGQEAARWAFTQWALRERAHAKFSLADQMLFTREALEQATHERVAEYHASLFPRGRLVVDMTCGIGGDAIALAKRGEVIGYDLDPDRLEPAKHNLEAHGLKAELRNEDSMKAEWFWDFAIADPSRRVEGRRTFNPADFEPFPADLSKRFIALKLGLIKLTPFLPDPYLIGLGERVEFVSFGGECREALLHCGRRAGSGFGARHLESGEWLDGQTAPTVTDKAGDWFFEADPAAIRAHALGTLCIRHNLQALADSNGYLAGDQPVTSPWLKPYEVIDSGAFDLKRLKGLKVSAVKTRTKAADSAKVAKTLGSSSTGPVLALYEMGKSVRYVLLRPVAS